MIVNAVSIVSTINAFVFEQSVFFLKILQEDLDPSFWITVSSLHNQIAFDSKSSSKWTTIFRCNTVNYWQKQNSQLVSLPITIMKNMQKHEFSSTLNVGNPRMHLPNKAVILMYDSIGMCVWFKCYAALLWPVSDNPVVEWLKGNPFVLDQRPCNIQRTFFD